MLKKLIISFSLFITSFAFFPVFAEDNSDMFMTLSEQNDRYAKDIEEDPDDFLSLDEYNTTYGNKEMSNDPQQLNSSSSWASSPVITELGKCQVGTITLQYQTDIQGGRPQFLYDRFYLSHPYLTTYWTLEYSTVNFSGDCISVYFSFIYGAMQDHAWVYFYPN